MLAPILSCINPAPKPMNAGRLEKVVGRVKIKNIAARECGGIDGSQFYLISRPTTPRASSPIPDPTIGQSTSSCRTMAMAPASNAARSFDQYRIIARVC